MAFSANCQQHTICSPASVSGVGYWSGRAVVVEFRPARPDHGIVFVRSDLDGHPSVKAVVSNRVEIPRRTTLVDGDCQVEMVEHILAALAGLRIDNCEVWVDSGEMPGCDGSSKAFVDALLTAGRKPQASTPRVIWVDDVFKVGDEESWVEIRPGSSGLTVDYELDYGSQNPVGRQRLSLLIQPETFQRELASARTFLLESEAIWLQSQGLGKHVSYEELLVFAADGPIGNALRFPDECVRHKMLDLVGDLALAGCRIVGQVRAHRSGHRLNAELVDLLLSRGQAVQPVRRCA